MQIHPWLNPIPGKRLDRQRHLPFSRLLPRNQRHFQRILEHLPQRATPLDGSPFRLQQKLIGNGYRCPHASSHHTYASRFQSTKKRKRSGDLRSPLVSGKASEIHTKAELRLSDLTDLKVDLRALKQPDLTIPQAWGLAIVNHPEKVDGFHFPSRFTGKRCTVLIDRKRIASTLKTKTISPLTDLEESANFLEANEIALA